MNGTRIAWAEARARLAQQPGLRFVELFRHRSLTVELYEPRGFDPQQPHTRDEVYVIVAGQGEFVLGQERLTFATGDFLFVPAGVPHRFEQFSDDLSVWVMFYGPEGGER